MCFILVDNMIGIPDGLIIYQLQLKCDTHIYHACVDHKMHTHICYTCVNLCFGSSATQVKKHRSYICVYTRFFTHMHTCKYWLLMHIATL